MTAVIVGEHRLVSEVLGDVAFWCGNCRKKTPLMELRVRINGKAYYGICCPHCGESIPVKNGHSLRDQDEQELRRALTSLVNEVRFKLWQDRQAGSVRSEPV